MFLHLNLSGAMLCTESQLIRTFRRREPTFFLLAASVLLWTLYSAKYVQMQGKIVHQVHRTRSVCSSAPACSTCHAKGPAPDIYWDAETDFGIGVSAQPPRRGSGTGPRRAAAGRLRARARLRRHGGPRPIAQAPDSPPGPDLAAERCLPRLAGDRSRWQPGGSPEGGSDCLPTIGAEAVRPAGASL